VEGNPKGLAMAVGYIADHATPLPVLVRELYEAADSVVGLLDYFCRQSWERCGEPARLLWQVLSFFATPAPRAVLEAVSGLAGRAFQEASAQLQGRALVDVAVGSDGIRRYQIHSLVRAFAVVSLRDDPAGAAAARERWVAWYGDFLGRHNQEDWEPLATLENEYENIVALIDWTLAQQHRQAPALVRHFWAFLYARGQWQRCETWTRQALEQLSHQEDPALRLWLAAHLGRIALWQGRPAEARQRLAGVEDEIERRGEPDLLRGTRVLYFRGQVSLWDGDTDQAEQCLVRFLALSEEQGDRWNALSARQSLAHLLARQGKAAAARRHYRLALEEARALGRRRVEAYCYYGLGRVCLQLGEFQEAAAWLDQAGVLADRGQELSLQADVLFAQAQLKYQQSQMTDALADANVALDFYRRLGAQADIEQVTTFVAHIAAE
jgi:tetratricopeptide (TPR) repeat protein